jgi:hypothetical protein
MTATATDETDDRDDREVGVADLFGALVMLPAVLAHELTHAGVAAPWAEVRLDRLVPPRLELEYSAGTPVLVVVVANLAPTLIGLLALPVALDLVLGTSIPVLTYGLGVWALYTLPSADDLAVLRALF